MANALPKMTIPGLKKLKGEKKKIVALTCYDYTMAQLLNEAGVDLLLVGDSLGMVKLGYSTTLPVTIEDMLYHTVIVAKGNTRAVLVADMPYLSYQISPEQAVENCGRMLKAGAHAVKIEGGAEMLPILDALKAAKIPVMGHLGMTPQSVHTFGGYKVQAREAEAIQKLEADAKALEKAGAFAIVLECIPTAVGNQISKALSIPTIGIGAGSGCDGQVIVIDDLIGMTPDPLPRFVKRYAKTRETIQKAATRFAKEVRSGKFPDAKHSYS